MNHNYLKLTTNIGKRKKKLAVLPIDVIQHIGLLTNSTSAYLNLALCCKQNSKILQKPKRWRFLEQLTTITYKEDCTEWRFNGKLQRTDGLPSIEMSDGTKMWYLYGKRDRKDGPALIKPDGTKMWFINDKKHREDGPAYIGSDGTKAWYINGKRHREDGPAYIETSGFKAWFINGLVHRDCKAGPAIIMFNGDQFYYRDGLIHREDGPAMIYATGREEWWINGERITKEAFNKIIS